MIRICVGTATGHVKLVFVPDTIGTQLLTYFRHIVTVDIKTVDSCMGICFYQSVD